MEPSETVKEGSPANQKQTADYPFGRGNIVWDIQKIQEIIPHRYPFLMVDRIIEFVDAQKIVGIKNVTATEP
jgi:hypothetical protein